MGKLRMISSTVGSGSRVRQRAMYVGAVVGEAGEEEAGLADGEVVEVFDVVCVGPGVFVADEGTMKATALPMPLPSGG